MSAILLGTLVLAIQLPDAVYIGIDSKVIAVGAEVVNVLPIPKIHQVIDVVFAHAGIFKDSQGKLDVEGIARASIVAGGNLEMVVDRFATADEPQLSAALTDIREQNPLYFKEKMKRPLEVLFAYARAGTPQVIVVFFEVMDPSASKLSFRITRLRCPGDCPKADGSWIALGEHDAADRFLDAHPEVLRTRGPIAAIEEAVAHQASATPDFVSLPTVVVRVDGVGVHFIK